MTVGTGCADGAVVHVRAETETFGGVANLALFLGGNVSQGLAGGQRAIMAGIAGFGCAAEYAVDVAGFAFGKNMLTQQRKAGVQMIEILSRGTALRRRDNKRHPGQYQRPD